MSDAAGKVADIASDVKDDVVEVASDIKDTVDEGAQYVSNTAVNLWNDAVDVALTADAYLTSTSSMSTDSNAETGIVKGVYRGAKSLVSGVVEAVKHPINTAIALDHMSGNSPEDRDFQEQMVTVCKIQC